MPALRQQVPRSAELHDLLPAQRAHIRRALLAWYDRHRRDLPWRTRTCDAYAQWVAEIMLQQTRVETVRTYYERFLERFPTAAALAAAELHHVLKAWEGLGYYRRAVHLHRAARQIAANGGKFPRTAQSLRELPGVGRYTAAAVASIAFDEPVAAVDGNVARVLARLLGVREPITSARGLLQIQNRADALMPRSRCGDFNQAWMDLGSAVCTPQNPRCAECPLQRRCTALQSGLTAVLPVRHRSATVPTIRVVTAVILHKDRMLVRNRGDSRLWSGLWEFPGEDVVDGDDPLAAVERIAGHYGLTLRHRPSAAGSVDHRLTHRLMRFEIYRVHVRTARIKVRSDDARWVTAEELAGLSISTAQRKVYRALSLTADS